MSELSQNLLQSSPCVEFNIAEFISEEEEIEEIQADHPLIVENSNALRHQAEREVQLCLEREAGLQLELGNEMRSDSNEAESDLVPDISFTSKSDDEEYEEGITIATKVHGSQPAKEPLEVFPELCESYKILQFIGEGTFSHVYKGILLSEGTEVAIKRMFPTSSTKRIMRELEMLHLLGGQHHVIGFRGWVQCQTWISIIFQYCQHQSFSDYYLAMNEEDVREYMRALFIALRHTHEHGIVHRDVKPSNFLCTFREYPASEPRPRFEYYLIDFGLAQPEKEAVCDIRFGCACLLTIKKRLLKRRPKKLADPTQSEKLAPNANNTNASNNNSNRNGAANQTNNNDATNSKFNTPPKKPPVKLEDFVKKLPNRDSPAKHQLFPKSNNNDAIEMSPSKKRKDNSSENLTSPKKIKGPMDSFVNNAKSPTKTNNIRNNIMNNNGRTLLRDEEERNHKVATNPKENLQVAREKEEEWNPQFELDGENLHTQRVNRSGTRGFRAPEILLRSSNQSTKIDIWSAGVILLSFLSTRYPFFYSPDDTTSLVEIMSVVGVAEVAQAASACGKSLYVGFSYEKIELPELCIRLGGRSFTDAAYDLLRRCLDPNPDTRISADTALSHQFFSGT